MAIDFSAIRQQAHAKYGMPLRKEEKSSSMAGNNPRHTEKDTAPSIAQKKKTIDFDAVRERANKLYGTPLRDRETKVDPFVKAIVNSQSRKTGEKSKESRTYTQPYIAGRDSARNAELPYAAALQAKPVKEPEEKAKKWKRGGLISTAPQQLPDEAALERYKGYAKIPQADDFEKESQYKSTYEPGTEKFNALIGQYIESGYGDLTYDILNRDPDAVARGSVAYYKHYNDLDDDTLKVFNYLYSTQGADAAYQYLDDMAVGEHFSGVEAMALGAYQGSGAASVSALLGKGLSALTGDKEAEKRNEKWYGDLLRDVSQAQEQHPVASTVGSVGGTLGLMSSIAMGVGALPGFTSMPAIAQSVVSGAASMGGTTAIQNAGYAATGMESLGDYGLDILTSAGAGAASGLAAGGVGAAGMSVLQKLGLGKNMLARTIAAGFAGAGGAAARSGVRQGSDALRGRDEFNSEELLEEALVGFAFSAISFFTRNFTAAPHSTVTQDGEEALANKYFEGMTKEEARAEYRRLSRIYHPDLYMNDTEEARAVAEAMMKEINAAWGWLNKNSGAQFYQDMQAAKQSGDTAGYQSAKSGFDSSVTEITTLAADGAFPGQEAQDAVAILEAVSKGGVAGPTGGGELTKVQTQLQTAISQGINQAQADAPAEIIPARVLDTDMGLDYDTLISIKTGGMQDGQVSKGGADGGDTQTSAEFPGLADIRQEIFGRADAGRDGAFSEIASSRTGRTYQFYKISAERLNQKQNAILGWAATDGVEVSFASDGIIRELKDSKEIETKSFSGLYLGDGRIILSGDGISYNHELFHHYEMIHKDAACRFSEITHMQIRMGDPKVMTFLEENVTAENIQSEIAASVFNSLQRGEFAEWDGFFSNPEAVRLAYEQFLAESGVRGAAIAEDSPTALPAVQGGRFSFADVPLIQAIPGWEKAPEQIEALEEKSSSQMGASDGIMAEIRDSFKEGRTHGERRKETREAFTQRSIGEGFTVHEGKDIAYGYRRAGDIHIQDTAGGQIQAELSALGLDSAVMDGTVLVNVRDFSYEHFITEAAAIPGEAIFINIGVTGNPRNVAGHEACHFWKGTAAREAYIEVLQDNLDYACKAFREYQDSFERFYFDDEVDIFDAKQMALFMEELFAYISGDLHEGTKDAQLAPMFRDFEAVKAAWEILVRENQKGGSAQLSLKDAKAAGQPAQGGDSPILAILKRGETTPEGGENPQADSTVKGLQSDSFVQAILNSLKGSTPDRNKGQPYQSDDPFIRILLGQEKPTPGSGGGQPYQSDDPFIRILLGQEKPTPDSTETQPVQRDDTPIQAMPGQKKTPTEIAPAEALNTDTGLGHDTFIGMKTGGIEDEKGAHRRDTQAPIEFPGLADTWQAVSGGTDTGGDGTLSQITSGRTGRTYQFRKITAERLNQKQNAILKRAVTDGVEVSFVEDGRLQILNGDGECREKSFRGLYIGDGKILLSADGDSYGHELFHHYEMIYKNAACRFSEIAQQQIKMGDPKVMAFLEKSVTEENIQSEIAASVFNSFQRGKFREWDGFFSNPEAVRLAYEQFLAESGVKRTTIT